MQDKIETDTHKAVRLETDHTIYAVFIKEELQNRRVGYYYSKLDVISGSYSIGSWITYVNFVY